MVHIQAQSTQGGGGGRHYLSQEALVGGFGPGVGVFLGVVGVAAAAAAAAVDDHVHLAFVLQHGMAGIHSTWVVGVGGFVGGGW